MENNTKKIMELLLHSVKNEFNSAHEALTTALNRLKKALNRLGNRDSYHVTDSFPDVEKLLISSRTKHEQL